MKSITSFVCLQQPIGYEEKYNHPILLWGGIGISLGMIVLGKRVIVTLGNKISSLTPSLGFTVVLASGILVMMSTILGIPTSTTHVQVIFQAHREFFDVR